MSLISFFKQPIFSAPDDIYRPLRKFTATTDADKAIEIRDSISELNDAARNFSSSKSFSKSYLEQIRLAENYSAANHWNEAHQAIWEATFLVNRALESGDARRFRQCVSWYLILWLVALACLGFWLKGIEANTGAVYYFGSMYWKYLLMGALGGITIAVWGLISHAADLDFDTHFALWYLLKPVLGAIMGLIAVITVQAGIFAVEGKPALKGQMTLYILAFLAGFSERFFIRIIDRVMTALFGGEQSAQPTKPTIVKP